MLGKVIDLSAPGKEDDIDEPEDDDLDQEE
jgi:hypothetical protein